MRERNEADLVAFMAADHEQSVGTTWTISFKAIKARSECAMQALIQLWAFFGT